MSTVTEESAPAPAPARSTLTLQAITDEWAALDALLEETQGELTPEIEAWMEEYGQALMRKSDNYADLIKDLEKRVEPLKEEAKRLAARAKALDTRREGLKAWMGLCMQRMQRDVIEGPRWTVRRQKAGAARLVVDMALLPAEYTMEVQPPPPPPPPGPSIVADSDKIGAALREGVEIPGARLEQSYAVRIY